MPYGLYLSADGVNAQSKRLEVLANNLANVDTTGFKRQLALFQARHAPPQPAEPLEAHSGGLSVLATATDYSPGSLKTTGGETDMAILSNGFFQVVKDGRPMLTRAGNFEFDSAGRLVTQQGYPVLNSQGLPVAIDPALGVPRIGENGVISQWADGVLSPVNDVAVVRPRSLGDLVHAGENLFAPLAEVLPLLPHERQLRVGVLEQSTVKPTLEMMELIEASRALEANVNLIRTQDQMLGALVGRALRPQ